MKRILVAAGVLGYMMVQSASAVIIIGGATGNGNFDSGTPNSGWTTAVPGDKFYLGAGTAGMSAYMNGWTVVRTRYQGANNTIGFNDNIALSSGTGDMVAFANAGDMDVLSNTNAVSLTAGQTLNLSFQYATRVIDPVYNSITAPAISQYTATLFFDNGDSHSFNMVAITNNTSGTTFSGSYELPSDYSFVQLKISFVDATPNGSFTANGGVVDDVFLEVIPEPATLGLVAAMGGAILFIRRRLAL